MALEPYIMKLVSVSPDYILLLSFSSIFFVFLWAFDQLQPEMIDIWSLCSCVVALITLALTHWIYRWRNPKCRGILPPGSSGLPLIGGTLNPLESSNLGPPPFIKARLEKYGPLFRTKIRFRNLAVSADPQVNNFLTLQEGKLIELWYVDSFFKLFKLEETSSDTLHMHKYVRERFLRHVGVESVKEKLLPEFQETVCRALDSWSSQEDSVEVKSAAAAMLVQTGAKIAVSCNPEESLQLLNIYNRLYGAFMCLPINIPGTSYHKALKAKEQLLKILSGKVKARLASSGNRKEDFLDLLLEDMKNEKLVTIDVIAHLSFSLIFATFGAISEACAFAINFISENPSVLDELLVEHEEILKKKDNSSSSITWQEFKSMTFSLQVVNETLRMGSIVPGFFRRAKKDIEINGYTIPAGWEIMMINTAAHFNPDIYEDPFKFNPWRWKDLDPNVTGKNFTPFGGGIRYCVGAEYSRAFMCIFLHVLVTKYRWNKLGDLHIKITKKHN